MEATGTGTRTLDIMERGLLLAALLGIFAWGFSGSWELPTVEIEVPPDQRLLTAGVVPSGEELFQANGCSACHALDGTRKIGPGLGGIFGTTVELDDGSTGLVDRAYLIESVLQPQARLVAGFGDAAMPSYEGLVSEEQARALADYIASLM